MSYSIKITEEAKWEIKDAKAWYEEQSLGLGERFTETVKQYIDTLKNPNKEHKAVYNNFRRVLIKQFPYVIYYHRNNEQQIVTVIAVLHSKQNHAIVKSRLG